LDGTEQISVRTGIGFLDHMLTGFATHAGFDLILSCKGDLEVDSHHTAEDIGIVLGQAFKDALGDKKGIKRFANVFIPMDEAMSFCALDISGRGYCVFDAKFNYKLCGDFETDSIKEFFVAFALNAGVTLHIRNVYGENDHHIAESMFKALARAIKDAITVSGTKIPSSKGVL
jgi:imidazoleglycerol-phosphate dehydratase